MCNMFAEFSTIHAHSLLTKYLFSHFIWLLLFYCTTVDSSGRAKQPYASHHFYPLSAMLIRLCFNFFSLRRKTKRNEICFECVLLLSLQNVNNCFASFASFQFNLFRFDCKEDFLILVQLISSQLVSSQLISSQLISSQLVSATTVNGTTAIAIQLILAYNCYRTQLLSAHL